MRTDQKRNLSKGLLAGAVGGLIASFAMSQFHSFFESRSVRPWYPGRFDREDRVGNLANLLPS